jgi:hypothetical protein
VPGRKCSFSTLITAFLKAFLRHSQLANLSPSMGCANYRTHWTLSFPFYCRLSNMASNVRSHVVGDDKGNSSGDDPLAVKGGGSEWLRSFR